MIITVTVNPYSGNERVEKISKSEYKAFFNAVPKNNLANEKLIGMLSDYFKLPKSKIEIKLGKTSREKVVEILDI